MSRSREYVVQLSGGDAVRLLLAVVAIAAFLLILPLALLPSTPGAVRLGPYSFQRIGLMAGLFLPMVLCIVLLGAGYRNPRRQEAWAEVLYGPRQFALLGPAIIAVILGLGFLSMAVFDPGPLESLTRYHVVRLLPQAVWISLALGLLLASQRLVRRPVVLRLSSSSLDGAICLLLYAVAALVRLPTTGYGLPYQAVWDEVTTYARALEFLSPTPIVPSTGIPGYGNASYGDLLVYATAAPQLAGLFAGLRTGAVSSLTDYVNPPRGVATVFEAVHHSGLPLLYPRTMMVLVNSLLPVLIFLALRRMLDATRWIAFGGGWVFAVFSRDVIYYTSYVLPDGLATVLAFAAVLVAMEVASAPNAKDFLYLGCGVLAGMALGISIRYASLACLPFLALAVAADRRRPGLKVGLGVAGLAATFLMSSPGIFLDLPAYLQRVGSLSWLNNSAWHHRMESLVFYLRGLFASGFSSGYVDSAAGSVGFGWGVGALFVFGLVWLIFKLPRIGWLLITLMGIHLWLVSPIVLRFTRHALLLYPIVCLVGARGLQSLADGAQSFLLRRRALGWQVVDHLRDSRSWMSAAVLILAVVIGSRQVQLTVRYVERMHAFRPSQVEMAEYLESNLPQGTKVGIIDLIPWEETDLEDREIEYERVSARVTLDELRSRGIGFVVGTDRVGGEFPSMAGTLWAPGATVFGAKVAESGFRPLLFRGYPTGSLYLFAAKVPSLGP